MYRLTALLSVLSLLPAPSAGHGGALPAAGPQSGAANSAVTADAGQAEAGRIAGHVEISAALTSRRPQFRIYSDARPGAVVPRIPANELSSELRNVVLYLQADSGLAVPATHAASAGAMSQIGERFDPHVLPVLLGTRVEFPNYDDVYHNVFSLSRAHTFDLGRFPKGTSRSVAFTKPGIVQVFCHIHADMSGVVLVLPNRFFTAPDTAGRYAIEGVPPGDYTIVGWHERTRPAANRVRVVAGETTTINFRLPLGVGPEP